MGIQRHQRPLALLDPVEDDGVGQALGLSGPVEFGCAADDGVDGARAHFPFEHGRDLGPNLRLAADRLESGVLHLWRRGFRVHVGVVEEDRLAVVLPAGGDRVGHLRGELLLPQCRVDGQTDCQVGDLAALDGGGGRLGIHQVSLEELACLMDPAGIPAHQADVVSGVVVEVTGVMATPDPNVCSAHITVVWHVSTVNIDRGRATTGHR